MIRRTTVGIAETAADYGLADHVPLDLRTLTGAQSDIPGIAHNPRPIAVIEDAVQRIPTHHELLLGDARELDDIPDESVHLVVTSPPYWTLKDYNPSAGQMGDIEDYDEFLAELDKVWAHCFRVLVPGGRVVCIVGDVLKSRRQNNGRHTVVPLHASIQEHCRAIGFDNLAPIIWYKIGNAKYEAGGGGFLGKPYEPNAVVKNDIEYILFQRKPGGYRTPTWDARILSVISHENYQRWFQQVWSGLGGASTRSHPAPYPLELAERLIRMFRFVGDTVLDPFLGTGTTSLAVIEMKSQVGSFGNNVNSRVEEALGSAFDLQRAHLHQAFGDTLPPWLGYVFVLEERDGPKGSTHPVSVQSPHFPVFAEFQQASYVDRIGELCRRLVSEQIYSASWFLLTRPDRSFRHSDLQLSAAVFLESLQGHLRAQLAAEA